MLAHFIIYYSICTCSIYFIHQVLNLNFFTKETYIRLSFFTCIFMCILHICNPFNTIIRIGLAFILTHLFVSISIKRTLSFSFIITLISFSINISLHTIISLIICPLLLLYYKSSTNFSYISAYMLSSIIYCLCTVLLLKSKRYRRGMLLFINNKCVHIFGIILSLISIIIIIITSNQTISTYSFRILLLFSLLISSLFLLYYWRYRITQTYRDRLRIANEKSLEDELNSQKEMIADLEADNARLSQIVHKDNKIILAMLTAVTEHLENTISFTPEELAIQGKELSTQLQDMAKDRQGILSTQIRKTNILPKSGLHTVDGMLSFMETRAKEAGITYKLQIEENIKEIASNAIPEADLLHLLGDLIDNAIIATKHADNKHEILIHLGILQNHFLLEVSDSGIPFSLDTYQSFGNEPHTTHRNDGGSGIGLMDIWKLKKKYKVSLHIYEYEEDDAIYTKKLTFIFDYKNHFLLQTPRYKEAVYTLTRGDLHIFPTKTE